MNDGFLSQEEIDSLLTEPGNEDSTPQEENKAEDDKVEDVQKDDANEATPEPDLLSDLERDLLGEIGNISMGSASTALSTIINQSVNITTPVVTLTTLKKLKNSFEVPNIALEVKYTSGIIGENLLVMKIIDAAVIAKLMMSQEPTVDEGIKDLSEIEQSAVSEAMNQMIGSAATSMATMLSREVNISPPTSKIWNDLTDPISENLTENEPIVKVSFKLTIGDLVDSHIMQILPIDTAKKIVAIMTGTENADSNAANNQAKAAAETTQPKVEQSQPQPQPQPQPQAQAQPIQEKPIETQPKVQVKQASFQDLGGGSRAKDPKNIDLILDVPLEISVVLGRTKRNIKDILNFGTGSLIELDRLAEEPVEILVNGKRVAYGEVVVVDENFGVRITSIISSQDRVKSLGE